jgi:hypothetical protein
MKEDAVLASQFKDAHAEHQITARVCAREFGHKKSGKESDGLIHISEPKIRAI